ncbi:hypothetical protein GC105_02340 [Alkalibaculum sp. M08DMB]|uniref:Uncharacterized protein n=1 Tax=Alkalibaculum sporogenes TaxID=2655001 RepID=A0A6A7K5H4_9FIRM|nr:hypothetical protein [Alkalibaculum sporogenes]MPW24632.1 hypothetical protein [Alkalibaculum sporogenes]
MRHRIKIFVFFLFIVFILAMGIREVNYNNYEIIENADKEVIIINVENNQTHIKIFGEYIVINENINNYFNNIVNKFK